jgi:nitroreductase
MGWPGYPQAMSDATDQRDRAAVVLSALRRTRQVRQFTDEPVAADDLRAILNVARWTGSSTNWQPWHFHVIRDAARRARIAELAPYARHVAGAAVAIAIEMPAENEQWETYDEGRVAERILVAARALGLGAGIGWISSKVRAEVGELLGLVPPAYVRTIISIGHPSATAQAPKSAPGAARKPLSELVIDD